MLWKLSRVAYIGATRASLPIRLNGNRRKRKRHAVSHDSTVNSISPLPNEMYGDEYDSSAASPYPQPRFSAPYLKGKPTQFEGKVKEGITMLLASTNLPSPAPVP